jgi:chromosome partitioning protein
MAKRKKYSRVAIASNKGGVGRTNTAMTIAGILADHYEEETMMVDLDPQANLSFILGCDLEQEDSKTELAIKGEEWVTQAIDGFDNLSVLVATEELKSEVVVRADDQMLHHELSDIDAHIICDTASDDNHLVRQALNLSDKIIVVMDTDKASFKAVLKTIDRIEKKNKYLKKNKKKWAIVMNQFEKRTIAANELSDTLEEMYPGVEIFKVSKSTAVKNARLAGKMLTRDSKAKKTVNEVAKIVEWITEG